MGFIRSGDLDVELYELASCTCYG